MNDHSVEDEVKLIEAKASAKEAASRFIGRYGLPILGLLVVVTVGAAMVLPSEALTPVIGLVTAVGTAIIAMLQGITGTTDKEEKPEVQIIKDLVDRLDQKEPPMSVLVDGEKVTVTKGEDTVTTRRDK